MQKKCRRCGDTFTVRTHEDYCPSCEIVMTPPGGGVSKELTCEGCNTTFVHTKEKAQGRWPKYCPECLPKYSKVPKKKDVQAIAEKVVQTIEDQQLPYHLGNVIKYIARAGYKGDKIEDLKKARWYLDRYINEVMQHD